jgi:hypothetical protein
MMSGAGWLGAKNGVEENGRLFPLILIEIYFIELL